jgi:hypothetical protein
MLEGRGLTFFQNLNVLLDRFSAIAETFQDVIAERIQHLTPLNSPIETSQFLENLASGLTPERCNLIYKLDFSHRPISLDVLNTATHLFPNLKHLRIKNANRYPAGFVIPPEFKARFHKFEE